MNETQKMELHQPQNGTHMANAYRARELTPLVDVYENAEEVLIVADVPGVSAEGIDINLEQESLTLTARGDGIEYVRTFHVPPAIDPDRIVAHTRHGTLLIQLPKSERAKPRRVKVNAG